MSEHLFTCSNSDHHRLLEGKGIGYPQHGHNVTFKRAPRAESPQPEQLTLAPTETPKTRSRRK